MAEKIEEIIVILVITLVIWCLFLYACNNIAHVIAQSIALPIQLIQ